MIINIFVVIIVAAVAVIIIVIQHSTSNGPNVQREKDYYSIIISIRSFMPSMRFIALSRPSIISPRISRLRRAFFGQFSNFHLWLLKAVYANFLLILMHQLWHKVVFIKTTELKLIRTKSIDWWKGFVIIDE